MADHDHSSDQPVCVLQLTGTSDGGVRRHVHQLAGLLAGGTHGERPPYRVVLAGPDGVIDDAPVPAVRVDITDRPRAGDLRVVRRLRALARGAGADGRAGLVHAHGLRAGALAGLALLGTPVPLVVTLHNKPVGGRAIQAATAVLARIVGHRAGAVLGVSGDLVEWARGWGVPIVERALVPAPPPARPGTPIPTDELGLSIPAADDAPILLTVARLAPQKGMELLVEAARIVAAEFPDARWLVAGDGPLREELTEAADGGIVTFLGARSDVADLLATASVVVSTSEWEGQPLNLQEALQAGVAIVTTDVGGSGEVTGDAAVRVGYDAREVADAVLDLLRNPRERRRRGEAAAERANELPTTSDMVEQADRIYFRLLG